LIRRFVRRHRRLHLVAQSIIISRELAKKHLLDTSAARIIAVSRGRSQLSLARLINIVDLCSRLNRDHVPGAFVECGVWRGGSAAVIGHMAKNHRPARMCWFLDSFEGMPAGRPEDGIGSIGIEPFDSADSSGTLHPIGVNVAPLEDVAQFLFVEAGLEPASVELCKGWFQNTLPVVTQDVGEVALLRLDGDWYESTKVCLEYLYPLVSSGGYIIIDDYFAFPGCRRALHEYFDAQSIKPQLLKIDSDGVWFAKP
jgi:O-methyltransferase